MQSAAAPTYEEKAQPLAKSYRARDSLWLMVVVALALRLALIAFLYHGVMKPRRDHWPFGYETGRIARSIALGEGFSNPLFERTGPTAWMTPAYPYLLAGVFKVFGIFTLTSAWVILSLDSLFSALTCLPVFHLARRSFGPVAAWAGWAWAFFPYAVYLSADFIWENTLTCLLLTILIVLTLRLAQPASFRVWAGFGALWGLTALTNPVVLSVLPFLAGWACHRLHREKQRWFRPAALSALAFLIVVAPWFVRNHRVFHRFIPFRDNFWLEVWVGNNGDTSNWFVDAAHPSNSDKELQEYDRLGELNYMAKKRREAIAFLTQHPGTYLLTSLRRFVYTWTGYWSFAPGYLAEESLDPANIVFSVPLTVLMLVGLRWTFRDAREVAPVYALVLLIFPLVYYFTHPEIRYRHTIDPEVVVLAVYGVLHRYAAAQKPAAGSWANFRLAR